MPGLQVGDQVGRAVVGAVVGDHDLVGPASLGECALDRFGQHAPLVVRRDHHADVVTGHGASQARGRSLR